MNSIRPPELSANGKYLSLFKVDKAHWHICSQRICDNHNPFPCWWERCADEDFSLCGECLQTGRRDPRPQAVPLADRSEA